MTKYDKSTIQWISSLSGFQGGNPASDLWFCGLEYQGHDLSVIDRPESWHSVSNPPSLLGGEYAKPDHGGQEFNKCITMIAEYYYKDGYKISNPFDKHGKIFKLNLYSLPQKATGEFFDEDTFKKTKILTKSELRTLSMDTGLEGVLSRFDNFKLLLENNRDNVKAIVGCSRDAMFDFVIAFAKKEEFFRCKAELHKNETLISNSGKKGNYMTWCKLESGQLLFIIPFLGGRNPSFKTPENMEIVANKIREVLYELKVI